MRVKIKKLPEIILVGLMVILAIVCSIVFTPPFTPIKKKRDIYEYIMSNQDLWKGCNISATNTDKIRELVFDCDDTSRFITLNLKEKK